MQRKPGFPVANCSIKMPDSAMPEPPPEEDGEQRRQQLINFGHVQWGFNNWSWSVSKQELDFVDFVNGKYCAGVVAFVSITVKTFDIHRENIGYATSVAPSKGAAIYRSRKSAVTNALRETLLSFGGSVATELMELLESHKTDTPAPAVPAAPAEPLPDNQNVPNKTEPKNSPLNKIVRKDSSDSNCSNQMRSPHPVPPAIKNAVVPNPPPIAKAHPITANLPPAANRPPLPANAPRPPHPAPPHVRPNSNEPVKAEPVLQPEEEARAERKRRQRLAQEEFRQKQLLKLKTGLDENQDPKASSSFDHLLMEIPTQDIVIESTGDTVPAGADAEAGKRKSPGHDSVAKRRSVMNRLDIVTD